MTAALNKTTHYSINEWANMLSLVAAVQLAQIIY